MYLKLFHGRTNPDEEMDDWGIDGPIIGPAYISWTYGAVRFNMEHLIMLDSMIYFNGIYYGDFEILDQQDPRVSNAEKTECLMSAASFIRQLNKDKKMLADSNECPAILLYVEGGVIQEIIATSNVKIKVVDFDVFDGGEPEDYQTIQFGYPDAIVGIATFDHTHIRTEYDKKYKEYLDWLETKDSQEAN